MPTYILVGLLIAAALVLTFLFRKGAGFRRKEFVTLKVHKRLRHRHYSDLLCDVFFLRTKTKIPDSHLVREAIARGGYAFPKEIIVDWLASHPDLLPRDATILIELEPPQRGESRSKVAVIVTCPKGKMSDYRIVDCLPSGDGIFYAVVETADVGDTAPYRSKIPMVPRHA